MQPRAASQSSSPHLAASGTHRPAAPQRVEDGQWVPHGGRSGRQTARSAWSEGTQRAPEGQSRVAWQRERHPGAPWTIKLPSGQAGEPSAMQAPPSRRIDIKLSWPQPSGITVHALGPHRSLLLWVEGDEVRAYCNLCQHLPIPLDGGTGRLERLQCSTHGAVYDGRTGRCTRGPCMGRSLHGLRAVRKGDVLQIWGDWPES